MHTAICSFEQRAEAESAVQRLADAGFDRRDVHMEHRHADGSRMGGAGDGDGHDANNRWDGMEREVAVDRRTVERFGHFFSRLFGTDDTSGHSERYAGAVERGLYVVVVDGHDEAGADRAQSVLHGMNPADLNRVHRPQQRPLRDIVGERQSASMERSFGTARADMAPSHNTEVKGDGEFPRERATASQGWGEQRTLELRDQPEPDDASHAPGLRYADQDDKPR